MAEIGINVDPRKVTPAMARITRASWARFVAYGARAKSDTDTYRDAGLKPLVVFAKESAQLIGKDPLDFEGVARYYALQQWDGSKGRFRAAAYQIGNEADSAGESSFLMTQAQFQAQLEAFARHFRRYDPNVVLVAGGLVSGNPRWLAEGGGVNTFGMPLAIHPYDQRYPGSADWGHGWIDQFLPLYGPGPHWITEWGRTTADRRLQAQYVREMGRYLRDRPSIAVAFYFCYSDAMVEPYGLVDANDSPKDALAEFQRLRKPEFVLGFKEAHDRYPELIGDALEDEHSFTEHYNTQATENGLLVYVKASGDKLFLPGRRV